MIMWNVLFKISFWIKKSNKLIFFEKFKLNLIEYKN
jgi:hypothetical protein